MSSTRRIAVLISGNGTNLQTILNACSTNRLNANVCAVISNKTSAYGLERAKQFNIPSHIVPYKKDSMTREEYDTSLADIVRQYNPHYIVLAGWMRVLTPSFLDVFPNKVVNLHPSLPGGFVGANCIKKAYDQFIADDCTDTGRGGIMTHFVIPEVDMGQYISAMRIPINSDDTLETYEARVHKYEHIIMLNTIELLTSEIPIAHSIYPLVKKGKVRNVHDIGNNLYAIDHTDQLSSFDRHICDIRQKGGILTKSSAFWFELINKELNIPTHYVSSYNNIMIAKKCTVMPIEVVVRAYITGSTKTSLWTHYNNGARTYCDIAFPIGLVKNQRLDEPVITPTTKGDYEDVPISADSIIHQHYMTEEQRDKVFKMAMDVFKLGQRYADSRGLILVDTKYEFGITCDTREVVLIDEVHTCDSSRFWMKNTYEERFANGQEPDKYDKDVVRDYIKKHYDDPYNTIKFDVPDEMKEHTNQIYSAFYERLTGIRYSDIDMGLTDMSSIIDHFYENDYPRHFPTVITLAGSESDMGHIKKIEKCIKEQGIYTKYHIASAHKNTQTVMDTLKHYNNMNGKIIYVTVAGRSNALSGVVACNTQYPTIACPPFSDKVDMMVNINSTIQMPSKVPVMTILEPGNVALSIKRMFNL